MLGLLLEGALENRLRRSPTPLTAAVCFELNWGCHVNTLQFASEAPLQYRMRGTDTPDQRAILRALRLKHLADEESVQEQLHPRNAA